MKKYTLLAVLFLMTQNVFAGENSAYTFHWLDPDKVIYVLQNKVFEKEGTWYANIGYGSQTSNDFQSAKNLQFKTGYFFHEEWGVEAVYSTISNSNSDTFNNISASSVAVPFVRKYNSYFGAMAIYSPFYAKINTFNQIFYFDVSFGLGVASIDAESNKTAFRTENANLGFEAESFTGLLYKLGFRLYISRHWNLNFDILRQTFSAEKVKNPSEKTFKTETDMILAVGFTL